MKNTLLIPLIAFLTLSIGKLAAQDAAKTNTTTLKAGPQSVTNQVVTNPDVLVITGKIIDATTDEPVTNAKINFDRFGDELLQASIDDVGNYAIALNKKELGEPIRVVFKISGYKRFVIKAVEKNATYVDADIFLQPVESEEKSNANIKYMLREDPFNTMVIKMQ